MNIDMDIKSRIKNISEYFKGMQVELEVIYVIVAFPERWIIDDDLEKKFNVKVQPGTNFKGEYYFFSDMETGFDAIFDAIEYNVNKMLEAQERALMLAKKINELKELFSDENITLAELKTLKFDMVSLPAKKDFASKPIDDSDRKEGKRK